MVRGQLSALAGLLVLAIAQAQTEFDLDSPSKSGLTRMDAFGGDPVVASEVGKVPANMEPQDDNICDDIDDEGQPLVQFGDCSRECMSACSTPMCSMGCICGCKSDPALRAQLVAQLRTKGPKFSKLAAGLAKIRLQVAKGRTHPERNPRFQAHARRQQALRDAAAKRVRGEVRRRRTGGSFVRRAQKKDPAAAMDANGFSFATMGQNPRLPGAQAMYGGEVNFITDRGSPSVNTDDTRWYASAAPHEKEKWWEHDAKIPY